jgi:hypothetical protein
MVMLLLHNTKLPNHLGCGLYPRQLNPRPSKLPENLLCYMLLVSWYFPPSLGCHRTRNLYPDAVLFKGGTLVEANTSGQYCEWTGRQSSEEAK